MPKKKLKKQKESPQAQWLKTLIKYTDRNIKNDGTELDAFWIQQSTNLKKQLAEAK
jgi:hypothetical protein